MLCNTTLGAARADDTHFPMPSALLAEQGAELIFAPHASAVEIVDDTDHNKPPPPPPPSGSGVNEDAVAAVDAHFAPGQTVSREAGPAKLERWLRYVPARAYDNSVFVAICNQCGKGPAAHAGHRRTPGGGASFEEGSLSFVCGPSGEVLAGAGAGSGSGSGGAGVAESTPTGAGGSSLEPGSSSSSSSHSEESLLIHKLEAAELERVRGSTISFFRRWHHPKTRDWANSIAGSKL